MTVPDYGEAVYHPVMTALKWTSAALVAMLAFPAHADVSGPACVTDGDTLVVNGKRQRTRCVGGTRVRLFGIEALIRCTEGRRQQSGRLPFSASTGCRHPGGRLRS